MHRCSTCGQPATYFYREGTRIVFACRDHGLPSAGKWMNVRALGGAVLSTQQSMAQRAKRSA